MGVMNRKDYAKHKHGDVVKPKCHTGDGLTKQEFGKETDVNFIMKRYNATGQLPADMRAVQPIFADVSQMGSFADVLRRTHAAEDAFMHLPPELRFRFNNRPEELVEFLQDDRNRPEAEKLGLVEAKVIEPIPEPEVKPKGKGKPKADPEAD